MSNKHKIHVILLNYNNINGWFPAADGHIFRIFRLFKLDLDLEFKTHSYYYAELIRIMQFEFKYIQILKVLLLPVKHTESAGSFVILNGTHCIVLDLRFHD